MSNDETYLTLKELWEFATNHPQDRISGINLQSPTKKIVKFVVQGNGITQNQYASTVENDWNYLDLCGRDLNCGGCGHSDDVLGCQLADHLLPFYRNANRNVIVVITGRLFVVKPVDPTDAQPSTYMAVRNLESFKSTSLCTVKPSWCDTPLDMLKVMRTASGSSDIELIRSAIAKPLQSWPIHIGIDLEFFALRDNDDETWINTKSLDQRFPRLFEVEGWRRLGETEELNFGPDRTVKLFRFIVPETDLVREFGDPVERLLQSVRSE